MKKIIFILVVLLSIKNVSAQSYITKFLKDTTLVILEDNADSPYNTNMKKALQKMWTITPYRFITESEFNTQYAKKPGHFFLGKVNVNVSYSDNFSKNDFVSIKAFTFAEEDKKMEFKMVSGQPGHMYLEATFDHPLYKKQKYTHELDIYDYYFIIGYIQTYMKPPFPGVFCCNESRNKDANVLLHKKTFLITSEDIKAIGLDDEDVVKQYGPGIKIVEQDVINKAIESKDPGVVYFRTGKRKLKTVSGEYKEEKGDQYTYIVDASTGFPYYSKFTNWRDYMYKSYFKKMLAE